MSDFWCVLFVLNPYLFRNIIDIAIVMNEIFVRTNNVIIKFFWIGNLIDYKYV